MKRTRRNTAVSRTIQNQRTLSQEELDGVHLLNLDVDVSNETPRLEQEEVVVVENDDEELPSSLRQRTVGVSQERALYFATGQRTTSDMTSTSLETSNTTAATTEEKEQWPGYFNTARDLRKNRLAAQLSREKELKKKELEEKEKAPLWIPKREPRTRIFSRDDVIPRLRDLSLEVLAKYIDLLPTLEYIDTNARHQVAQAVVRQRRMNAAVLPLFIFPGINEIDLPDCSNIDEESFVRAIKTCTAGDLQLLALRLGLCGRCISDSVIEQLGDSLKSLERLLLAGCYRLSDAGCEMIAQNCAESLEEFEISCNQRITKQSIDQLCSLKYLHTLRIAECPQLTDSCLQSLSKMKNLRALSLDQMEKISDDFLINLATNLTHLQELSLARCTQLTDKSIIQILESCRSLKRLDLSDIPLITDYSLELIRKYGHPLRHVSLCRCIKLTDQGIEHVAFGAKDHLEVLEISSIGNLTDVSIQALIKYCIPSLRALDVSFCRTISEESLGILTDVSEKIESLVLWGCTQVTSRFLQCQGKDELLITGHPLLTGLTLRS